MLTPSAEESFARGRLALANGKRREALALFEASIEIERRRSQARPQPRYLSYYGLCLAIERGEVREALRYCREAVTLEGYNPDIRCNLGQVLLRAGRRKEAYRSFVRGLKADAQHRPSVDAIKTMGIRRKPFFAFLHRQNPLNVLLGRIRA
jgi:tetratricopeptide (TPR) repeat protein